MLLSELSDAQSVDRSQATSFYSSSPRTRQTVTVSRNTWFQRCSQGSRIRRESGACDVARDGSSWRQPMRQCDDPLLCLIAQPGRQAGQPNHRQRVRNPLTAPAVEERFWWRKPPPRTCRVKCGYIVHEKVRTPHIRGERRAPLKSAQSVLLQCSAKLCS